MRKQHRTALVVAVCAATTAGAALQTQANAAAEAPRGLDGLSGQEIAEKAAKQLNSAAALRLELKARDLRMQLSLDEKANCAGKVGIPGKGSIQMIKHGRTVWLKPDARFWKHQMGGEQGTSAAKRFKGAWIKGSSRDTTLGGAGVGTACDLDAFRAAAGADVGPGPHWKRGGHTEVRGHDAVAVTRQKGDVKITMLVSAEGKPRPLLLDRSAGSEHDQIHLGRYGKPVTPTKPPGGRSVDVSELRDSLKEPPSESV